MACYEDAGVAVDFGKVITLFLEVAEAYTAAAQYMLGVEGFLRQGTEFAIQESVRCLNPAARQDYSEGQLMPENLMFLKIALSQSGQIIAIGFFLVSLSLLVIAAIDAPYQINEFKKRVKMTLQEVKDEMKETEGRPEVKAQVRRRQRELAMNRMIHAVADADVIITNPEHFAVALAYNPATDDAPRVLAKGADHIAASIREKAKSEGIPFFNAPPLARALFFTTELNDAIPEALYYTVAQVIAYIFNLNSINADGLEQSAPKIKVPDELLFDQDGKRVTQGDVDARPQP